MIMKPINIYVARSKMPASCFKSSSSDQLSESGGKIAIVQAQPTVTKYGPKVLMSTADCSCSTKSHKIWSDGTADYQG
jgi:hypothetical protein